MAFWLAKTREGQASDHIQRFDPRFWTVNFPRPMTAAIVTTAPDALRVDAVFRATACICSIVRQGRHAVFLGTGKLPTNRWNQPVDRPLMPRLA
jgi:hypothetical protein